jgi:hypothetical protein
MKYVIRHLIVAVAALSAWVTLPGAAVSQETCRYCREVFDIWFEDKSGNALRHSLASNAANMEVAIMIADNIHPNAAINLDIIQDNILSANKVCKGVTFYVKSCYFSHRTQPRAPFTLRGGVSRIPCGICDGKLVHIDEYRAEPFKVMFDQERKKFQGQINDIALRLTEQKVNDQIKLLVSTELKEIQASWISRTAQATVDLLKKSP